MDVQHDDDESPATTESEEGWHTVHYGRREKPGHKSVRDADGFHGAHNKVEPGFGNTQAKTQERRMNCIEKASRMLKVPAADYIIVIRPRGGLRAATLGPTDITRGIHEAAATAPEVQHFDVICPYKTQNIMIVSTPDADEANQYRKIKKILIRGKECEVAEYDRAPEDTAKGIIKRIPLEETTGSSEAALVTERNHSIITAKQLGNTTTVIVLFSGNKRTSTRALDIETQKMTTNKIPLRFKEPQPCKVLPQFQGDRSTQLRQREQGEEAKEAALPRTKSAESIKAL
ncbi:hypothetical protein HPB51_015314 [Rhipicephalus microplus]|uniref:Uncharacterized protein n=1 Tax=Rhipicephalus microplus TaxID=6941 RepID=A0A9J6EHH8_RHIMP|nr:hypothetical protein HPB51_015314 [Rhipicephalus microplus]